MTRWLIPGTVIHNGAITQWIPIEDDSDDDFDDDDDEWDDDDDDGY